MYFLTTDKLRDKYGALGVRIEGLEHPVVAAVFAQLKSNKSALCELKEALLGNRNALNIELVSCIAAPVHDNLCRHFGTPHGNRQEQL